MKTYELNGKLYKFAEGKAPEGAKLHVKEVKAHVKAEPVKEEPKAEEVEAKAKPKTENKAKKPAANKSKKGSVTK